MGELILPTALILGSKVRNPKPLHDRGGPIPVHFARSSCGHADCAEHYDLSMACLRVSIRERSRVTFGEAPAPLYVDALCGTTHLWLMPDHYAVAWRAAHGRDKLHTARYLCRHCENAWRRMSSQTRRREVAPDDARTTIARIRRAAEVRRG